MLSSQVLHIRESLDFNPALLVSPRRIFAEEKQDKCMIRSVKQRQTQSCCAGVSAIVEVKIEELNFQYNISFSKNIFGNYLLHIHVTERSMKTDSLNQSICNQLVHFARLYDHVRYLIIHHLNSTASYS